MKIALGVFGGLALIAIVTIILLAVAFNKATKDVQKQNNAHAITQAEFDAMPLQQPKSVVLKGLPAPEDSQQFSEDNGSNVPALNSSCVYYNERTTGDNIIPDHFYQLCFDGNDLLSSKNSL